MKRNPRNPVVSVLMCCLLGASLLLQSGCSSIKVIETWGKPSVSRKPYQKPMVIAIWLDEGRRETAENLIVNELERGGVRAISSYPLVKTIENVKREDVVAAVRSSGADAVLSIRAIAKGDSAVSQAGQSAGVYGTATNLGGTFLPSATTYSRATLQANLYDSATAELVWTTTFSTYDAASTVRVSRDVGMFFLEKLRKDGFL